MTDEYSESGDPIHRYDDKGDDQPGWTPPNMEDSSMEAISDHIEAHIGPIDNVWHELISDLVHIDVHQVAPTEERPWWTLVTSGMSDISMSTPEGCEDFRYSELMICLPKDWPMEEKEFDKNENYWPVYWLKYLARFPHQYETWLSWGHTIPNGDPAEPVGPNVGFTGMMLTRPMAVSKDFWTLEIREDKRIEFFALFPLYTNEMDLKLKKGAEAIEELFEKNQITEVLNPTRPNLSQSPWWKIW